MMTSMQKMWVSFVGIGLFPIAIFTIYISRYKLKNRFLKIITAMIAWISLLIAGLIMLFVVFSGPTN